MPKEDSFKYYGNYLGICIEHRDPEYRGRVKIFIPHIMPALYENWNEAGFDITIDCVGNNLQNGLDSSVVERLRNILPWSECASPVFGTSVGGSYNPVTGMFNQTNYTAAENGIDPLSFNYQLDSEINENLAKYTMSIGARETGFDPKQANSNYYNAEKTVDGKSYRNANVANGIKNGLTLQQAQAKYGDYGYFQTNQDDVNHAISLGVPKDIAAAMNNGGGTGNYSPEQQARAVALYIKAYRPDAAAAASRGDFDTANSILKGKWPSLPGGKSHRPNLDYRANAFLTAKKTASLNDPTSDPDPSSLPPPPMPQRSAEGEDYTSNSQLPPSSAKLQTTDTGSLLPPAPTTDFASSFNQKVLRGKGELRSSKGTTLCGQGTRKAVGLALGDPYYSSTGFGTDYTSQTVQTGYWTKKGDFYNAGTVNSSQGYKPQQGDVLVHKVNKSGTGYGHAQVYLDGKWHSWKSDDDAIGYLTKSNQQTTLMRLTPQGKEKLKIAGVADANLIDKNGELLPSESRSQKENNDVEGDYTTNIAKNLTSTQAIPIDTTGMAQGMFSVPSPGALLWVFFREGNPLFPVYFAASYGANEWSSVYMKQGNSPAYYPKENDISPINNEAVLRPNSAGAIKFNGTVTPEKDFRSIKIGHSSGGFHELHPTGTIHYSPNEHVEQIGGTKFSYCLNREEWTQGTDNRVTIGNQFIVIGTPTKANLETIEKLTEKVKKINQEMLKD